jgi:tetratricopeptide (TPR) repeat protein
MAILKRRLVREKKLAEARQPEGQPLPAHPENGQAELVEEASQAEVSADAANPSQPATGNPNPAPSSKPVQTGAANPDAALEPPISDESVTLPIHKRKLSLMQIILILGIILSASFLTYSLVESQSGKQLPRMTADGGQKAEVGRQKTEDGGRKTEDIGQKLTRRSDNEGGTEHPPSEIKPASKVESATTAANGAQAESVDPLSLQVEEDYYAAKDYVRTYNACERLRQKLTGPDFELIRDFLQLRMALCLERYKNFDQANQLFRIVAESRSIALRAIANYHCSLLEMNAGQYLKARTRAYKTIALTGALALDEQWPLMLERECQYLAAEGVTRQVLSLCDADKDLPRQLWSKAIEKDPLAGLDETRLQTALNCGIERLNAGLLAPQIKALEPGTGAAGLNRWSVVCSGPGIDELMARFAANAALDVKWLHPVEGDDKTEPRPAQDKGWNRSVTLYLSASTAQQAATIAAGAAGLLAQVDESKTITISDPAEYSTLSEHTRQLSEHAIWLWRKLLLMYNDDQRTANAHFALGVLQGQKGQVAEAIAEYKLVASRYSHTTLAPFALLRSSRLKTNLRDYTGASRDLKQLIEQYPETELIDQAHIDLAETTMKAGLYDEACALYKKAHNLGFSDESKTIAAFGAGQCYYQMKDYKSAVEWLTRYIEAVDAQEHPAKTSAKSTPQNAGRLFTAYLLLGKSNLALGNIRAACDALQFTVRRATASDEYIEAISSLVEAQVKEQDYVAALDTIENVRVWPFSQEQTTRLLVLKSSILRKMGLTDQAIALLSDRTQYLTDQQLKAEIILEIARCCVASQKLELARTHFTDVLSLVEPGPFAQQASVELADVCLKLGEYQQTISICNQLLSSSASEQIKQQCSKILASAYSRQKNYDRAAASLLTASVLPETTKSGHE